MPRKPSKKTLENKLDKLVGAYVREKKTKGVCEYCNEKPDKARSVQWCHIKSRRYLSVRWDLDNCFCLCAKCHRYFTDNPDEFICWILDEHPEQYTRLQEKFQKATKITIVQLEDLYEKLSKELT